MELSLQYVQDQSFSELGRAIFDILKATLQYPAEPQAKAIKFADDVKFFYEASHQTTDKVAWETWWVVLDVVCCIPPDHPWQDSLVQSLDILRQRDGSDSNDDPSLASKILSSFSMTVREKWEALQGEEFSDDHDEYFWWKNYNSFIARITRNDFDFWLALPIWQLRETLEEPSVKGSEMRCRIWVASEWIIHCTDHIFNFVNTKEEIDESTARAYKGGSLYSGKPPLRVERWEFWKKRFSEIATDATSLELDGHTAVRISDALKVMDGVKA